MGEMALLESVVAAQLLYSLLSFIPSLTFFLTPYSSAALDVLGSHAKLVYGHQWNKMLALIYEGVTLGLGNGKFIGGKSAEGTAARVRVQMEVERLVASS